MGVLGRVFGRRERLPAALTPALERDERVLAWARAGADRAVVATNRGLWLPDGETSSRLRWHEINKAAWSDGKLTLTRAGSVPGPDGHADGTDFSVVRDEPPLTVVLAAPGDVPIRVRERVNASVAYTSYHPLPDGGHARVVARRVAGRNGLTWSVRYEGRVDASDPDVQKVTAELVASAKASISPPD
jgi:hypothetical protein